MHYTGGIFIPNKILYKKFTALYDALIVLHDCMMGGPQNKNQTAAHTITPVFGTKGSENGRTLYNQGDCKIFKYQ